MGEIPPPKLTAPEGAPLTIRLATPPPTFLGGQQSKVGSNSPTSASSQDAWRVVNTPRRTSRRKQPEKVIALPRSPILGRGCRAKKIMGSQRSPSQNICSPRQQYQLLGTDLEASESEGGNISDRPPRTVKKKGLPKGKSRKNVATD